MPTEGVLSLHDLRQSYAGSSELQPQLTALLHQGGLLADVVRVTRALGIQGPNYRESVIGNGLLSRNRAVLGSDLPGVLVIEAER